MTSFNGQFGVRHERAAEVRMVAQQYGLPKTIHLFQVLRPTVLDDVIENVFQEVIFAHFIVEAVYQQLNVIKVRYLFSVFHYNTFTMDGYCSQPVVQRYESFLFKTNLS